MNAQQLAEKIAEYIRSTGEELDNLGDGESIVFMSVIPTVNLVELAEYVQKQIDNGTP